MTSFVNAPRLQDEWYAVARSSDVDRGPVGAVVLGSPVVVWRSGEHLSGARDRCPHREAPLSLGHVDEVGRLVCPYHGWTFEPDGRCSSIPSQPDSTRVATRVTATTLPVVEQHGLIWICLGNPVTDVVKIPESEDPSYRVIAGEFEVWNVSAPRLAENFLDATHFSFVHEASFGGAADPVVVSTEFESDERQVAYSIEVTAANSAAARSTTQQEGSTLHRRMRMSVTLPFVSVNRVEYQNGLRHVILNAITPIDDHRCWFSMTIIRNDDFRVPADEAVFLDKLISTEDRELLEKISGTMPLDPRDLAHAPADRAGIEYLRRLRTLVESA